MWHKDQPSLTLADNTQVSPTDVLYEYDGPLIFTAKMGLSDVLFYKTEATSNEDRFLVTPTTPQIVQRLSDGTISVRGALNSRFHWIVETDTNLTIRRYWNVAREDLPPTLLPESGLGLRPDTPRAPDSVEQANSLFALKFFGADFSPAAMPFGRFKALLSGAYDSSRRILLPLTLIQNRRPDLDLTVGEPVFGSLVIVVKDELVARDTSKSELALIQREIIRNREEFFETMDELVAAARKKDITAAAAEEHFDVLDSISEILPSESGRISELELDAGSLTSPTVLLIDVETGTRMRVAHREAERKTISERGTIIEINSRSDTFIIMSTRHRQVTCIVPDNDTLQALNADRRFRIGSTVSMKGTLVRRPRRDKLYVQGPIRLSSHKRN